VEECQPTVCSADYSASRAWSVNEADKTLIRKYEIALIPNNDGRELKVSIGLAGDELKLVAIAANGDRNEVVYKRAK
jgi:hypothetical protein